MQIRSLPCNHYILIIFFYYLLRFAIKAAVKKAVANTIPDADEIIIAPTMRFFQWRVAASTANCHYVGRAYGRSVKFTIVSKEIQYPNTQKLKRR